MDASSLPPIAPPPPPPTSSSDDDYSWFLMSDQYYNNNHNQQSHHHHHDELVSNSLPHHHLPSSSSFSSSSYLHSPNQLSPFPPPPASFTTSTASATSPTIASSSPFSHSFHSSSTSLPPSPSSSSTVLSSVRKDSLSSTPGISAVLASAAVPSNGERESVKAPIPNPPSIPRKPVQSHRSSSLTNGSSSTTTPSYESPLPTNNHHRIHSDDTTMAVFPPTNNRPSALHINPNNRSISSTFAEVKQANTPGGKITAFFGRKPSTPPGGIDSVATPDLFDADRLQRSSPPTMHPSPVSTKSGAAPIDVAKANGIYQPSLSNGQLNHPSTPGFSNKVSELERELRDVSSELAGSIRREMDLEDMVDRLQMGLPPDQHPRTSDYFSDSGTGSEDLEKMKRSAEQERAQLKVEFSQRWQDERTHRAQLGSQVQFLENEVRQVRISPILYIHILLYLTVCAASSRTR